MGLWLFYAMSRVFSMIFFFFLSQFLCFIMYLFIYYLFILRSWFDHNLCYWGPISNNLYLHVWHIVSLLICNRFYSGDFMGIFTLPEENYDSLAIYLVIHLSASILIMLKFLCYTKEMFDSFLNMLSFFK